MQTIQLTLSEFLKYISQPNLKEDDFKKIIGELNEKYCEKSHEIILKNEERSEILNKIREAQKEYKKMFGINEVNSNLGQDDVNELEEESSIPSFCKCLIIVKTKLAQQWLNLVNRSKF